MTRTTALAAVLSAVWLGFVGAVALNGQDAGPGKYERAGARRTRVL